MSQTCPKIWHQYYHRAVFAAWLLRFLPFIRMVGLNGSMVRGQFKKTSDIDFLIICQPKRIFTSRFFVTALVFLLGWKRSNDHIAGQICLNRFADTDNLEITPHNSYHAWTFSSLKPIFSEQKVYDHYCLKNDWMSEFNYPIQKVKISLTNGLSAYLWQQSGEFILNSRLGDYLENFLAKKQRARIEAKLNQSKESWQVKVTNEELCFHLANCDQISE